VIVFLVSAFNHTIANLLLINNAPGLGLHHRYLAAAPPWPTNQSINQSLVSQPINR
jgi:hypothetical protein